MMTNFLEGKRLIKNPYRLDGVSIKAWKAFLNVCETKTC